MISDRKRLTSITLAVVFTTALFTALHLLYFDPLRKAELYTRDLRAVIGHKAAVDPQLVFLAMDKASIQLDQLFPEETDASRALTLMREGFPWSREVYALILDQLAAAGARLVVFDLLFPQRGEGDDVFQAALNRHHARVVLACDFVFKRAGGAMHAGLDLPTDTLIAPSSPVDLRVGFDTLWEDPDGVLRRVPFQITLRELTGLLPAHDDERYESLVARALRQLELTHLIKQSQPQLFRFAGPPGTFQARSLYEIFVPKLWEANYGNGAAFKGKIVMIGPEGGWSHDEHPTPFRIVASRSALMAGPEIQLQALNAALHGDYLREFTRGEETLAYVVAGVVAFAVSLLHGTWRRIFLVGGLIAAYALIAALVYDGAGLFLPFVGPAVIGLVGTVANVMSDYRREHIEREKLRATLEQYVAGPVVHQLLDDPSSYMNALGGVRKAVTVLFCDLRNFTGLTLGRDPAELVEQLNQYFSVMVEHVTSNNGTVDKLMGDSLMAVWGSLHSTGARADAIAAVRAAFAMSRSLPELNAQWREIGWPEFRFGIGIAHGDALVGNVGSKRKMDFTAIGDVTNVASRIQDLTSELDCEIIISDSLAALVKNHFVLQAAGPVPLKGRPKPVNIFIVTGEKTAAPDAEVHAAAL